MIRVVTIEREYGSGGADIARKLAERLGWELWDHLLTDEIARLMECDCQAVEEHEERRDSLRYRLFKAFMRGSFEGSLNAPRLKMVDADCIREVTERVVTAAAKTGNSVIVGRGSGYYLRDRPDVFHVFIYAPFEQKVRRLQETGKSEERAAELAETVDRDRAAYIKQYFGVEWPPRYLYHLMINSTLGDEVVVETILNSIAVFEKQSA
ncbi:MAG TPA: cytidylate kinase-like family protein [Bryobacteraceae bacterium]|nr:cytidylate kinase-like family protein [Bryobacteraceae bacterium]